MANGIIGVGGEIAWPKPAKPGDTLRTESEILEIIPSRSKVRLAYLGSFPLGYRAVDFRDSNGLRYPEELEDPDLNPGQVELIPRQSMPCRGGVRVVVVVPAFAGGDQSNQPVVAGVIAGFKPAAAPHVCR